MHRPGMKAIVKRSITIEVRTNTTKSLKIGVKNVMTQDTKPKTQTIVLENGDAVKNLIGTLKKSEDIVDVVLMWMKMIAVHIGSVEIKCIVVVKKGIVHQAEMTKIDMRGAIGKYTYLIMIKSIYDRKCSNANN